MWKRIGSPMLMVSLIPFAGCFSDSSSSPKVTHGVPETGFPYVVRIVMDGKGSCTGSFLSDSILLTAAHCVDKAQSVAVGNVVALRSEFRIHPEWPSEGDSCNLPRLPQNDVALVRFPPGTYSGQTARLSARSPNTGEQFKIVGFGNNEILPFEKFCRLPKSIDEDGKCNLQLGVQNQGSKYDYSSIFSFPATTGVIDANNQCADPCPKSTLQSALAQAGSSFDDVVLNQCDGNFRDRSYKETGAGIKRSGTNVVSEVSEGTVRFFGGLGGTATGTDSASGAGDSGGPFFIKIGNKWKIAAITHGGSLIDTDDQVVKKRSIYVDLNAAHNISWLKETWLSLTGTELSQ